MFQICKYWRRFSLIFLASLVFCSLSHAGSAGQAQPSVSVERPFIASPSVNGSQKAYSQAVQQGIERYQAGKFNEAIALWQQALPQISNPQDKAIIYSNLALAYRQIGQLDRAIAQWEQAIQIYRSQKDEGPRPALAKLLTEQGQAYNDLGQHKRAITLLQSAIEIAHKYSDQLTEAAAQGALGTAYWSIGDYEKALETHQTSLKFARDLNNSSYMATALNNLGNVYVSSGDRYSYQANLAQVEGDDKEFSRLTQAASQDGTQGRTYFEQSVQAVQGTSGLEEVRALMNLNRFLIRGEASGVSDLSQGQIINRNRALILTNFNRARALLQ